jgi:ubiquinone/menaquinone biosynthesis C-methylase UbiE
MFTESAELYDLIYASFKDYPAEATQLAALIRANHPRAKTILDVACGTGEHAHLLAEQFGFEVDGLDLDPTFVRIARAKLARGSVYEGDMTSFAVPKRYDVITCLFSAIGYVRTLENVRRALEHFRAHLTDGGIVLVEPWFAPGALQAGYVSVNSGSANDVKVTRMSLTEVEGRMSRLRFEYLIGRPSGIEHVSEVHELGLFTTDEMIQCFRDARLDVTYDATGLTGRGLFVARVAE